MEGESQSLTKISKELTNQITFLKKQMKASSKQKKKEIELEIAQLEEQKSQLSKALESADVGRLTTAVEQMQLPEASSAAVQPKGKKKRRDKLAEYEAQRQEALLEADTMPDYKAIEEQEIAELIAPSGLKIHSIVADGHCLYNSIAHQMNLIQDETMYDYKQLRAMASDYIRSNRDDFIPFLVDANGDMLSSDGFEQYCEDINGSVWGGQSEIQALCQALQIQIHVFQMGSSVLKLGTEFGDERIVKISYHKHAYSLGEHYNSLIAQ